MKGPSTKSTTDSKPRIKYPFRVDYNDHFETPHIAYEHILPLLDAVAPNSSYENHDDTNNKHGQRVKKKKRRRQSKESCDASTSTGMMIIEAQNQSTTCMTRSEHIIYDPYYCNGKMKEIFKGFGFTNIQHEKRDFYKDIKLNVVPKFHTLVTNPPYSGNHKEKCMQFAMEHLRPCKKSNDGGDSNAICNTKEINSNTSKPFFILMPNYVACRNHFRSSILNPISGGNAVTDPLDILYIVPSIPYDYEHPEGTGKDIPPFSSIWYCGIPLSKVEKFKDAFRIAYGKDSVGLPKKEIRGIDPSQQSSSDSSPRLLFSLEDLKQMNAVPTQKRPNPKQRKKARLAKLKGDENSRSTFLRPNEQSNVNNKDKQVNKKKRKRRY